MEGPPLRDCRLPIADFEDPSVSRVRVFVRHSAIVNVPRPSGAHRLGLDGRLIDQHDRYVVFNSVDPVALHTLQTLRVLAIFERLLASRTNQNLQKVFGNHDVGIVRQGLEGPCDDDHRRTGAGIMGQELLVLDC
jgi:hypothetical protein